MELIAKALLEQELLLLFVVVALGLLLSRLQVGGVRLGVAAVLFAGIGVSAWVEPTKELLLTQHMKEFGLVLFVYCVGLTSAPGFFSAWRSHGLRLNVGVVLALVVGAGTAIALGRAAQLAPGFIAGVFSGALTNTPALGAATDRLEGTAYALNPALGYSVTYPFGVLGALICLRAFASRRSQRLSDEQERYRRERAEELSSRNFEVTNDTVVNRSIGELRVRDEIAVVISRVGRSGDSLVPTKYTVLEQGDVVTAVGASDALERAAAFFGAASGERLEARREHNDMRRVLVSRKELVGKPLGDLELDRRFNAQVTRLRRADLDILPSADMRLALGDRLRVVAPVARLREVSEFFGDSERALAEVDMLALALGLVAGLVLALIPLPGSGELTLGLAGGPLVVGLVLGRLGRTGSLVWAIPYEAGWVLREFGIVMFLAGVGVSAGGKLRSIELGQAMSLFGVGVVVTLLTTLVALISFDRAKVGVINGLGACSGLHTQPATLAAAYELTGRSEQTYVAYAVAYPVAMIGKVLIAQLLALFA